MSAWSEMVRTSSPRLRHTATTLAPALGTLALGSALLVFYPQQRLVLTRLALRLYRAYGAAAMGSPLLTKAATSGVAYCLGDMLAQRFSADGGRELVAGESAGGGLVGASATSAVPFFFDAPRAARSAIAGFFSHGPQLHYWCLLLERYVSFGGAWYALLVKIALDQVAFLKKKQKKRKEKAPLVKIVLDQVAFCLSLIFSIYHTCHSSFTSPKSIQEALFPSHSQPISPHTPHFPFPRIHERDVCSFLQTLFSAYLNTVYCASLELMKRSDRKSAWLRIKGSLLPSLQAGWKFWPLVHVLTYSVVPLHLRVLWVDLVEIVWVAVLSVCINQTGREAEVEEQVDLLETHLSENLAEEQGGKILVAVEC